MPTEHEPTHAPPAEPSHEPSPGVAHGRAPVPEPLGATIRRLARVLIGGGASAGVFITAALTPLVLAARKGQSLTFDLTFFLLLALGLAQVIMTVFRYRQLSRLLRTGFATRLEELADEAERGSPR